MGPNPLWLLSLQEERGRIPGEERDIQREEDHDRYWSHVATSQGMPKVTKKTGTAKKGTPLEFQRHHGLTCTL